MAQPAFDLDSAPGGGAPEQVHLRPAPDPPAQAPEPEDGAGSAYATDTAADMGRLGAWAAATFRPPQVWTQRPLSASEALAAARNTAAPGRWALLRRGYGYAAAGATAAAVALIWLIQSPARAATGLLLAGVVLFSLFLLLT